MTCQKMVHRCPEAVHIRSGIYAASDRLRNDGQCIPVKNMGGAAVISPRNIAVPFLVGPCLPIGIVHRCKIIRQCFELFGR